MINSVNVLQIIIIVTGIFLQIVTINSLAHRKMTESFCLAWGLIGLILVLSGLFLRPTEWSSFISPMGLMLVVMIGFCVVYVAYFMSTKVSELSRRNQELAIQVSLLRQENQQIMEQLEQMTMAEENERKCEENEKDSLCD
ncbi:MAG: DUF2304 domain-containing protein [Acetatifactor sp.]|nr:DUF2304 domain-containing protein [Acetatifactor sp.]